MTSRARDLLRPDRGWKANLREQILVALRAVPTGITVGDLRTMLPRTSTEQIDADPTALLTELHSLVEAGRVTRVDSGGIGPATFLPRQPKRLVGLMIKGPGDRLPTCRRYEGCLAAAAQQDGESHCPGRECFVAPQPLEAFALATAGRGSSPMAAFLVHEMAGVE